MMTGMSAMPAGKAGVCATLICRVGGDCDDARLPQPAANLIADPSHLILVSAASAWEIAIKHGLARGRANDMPVSASDALGYFRAAGYDLLAVTTDHAAAVAALPSLHRDPFDRIIIAQALHEPLRLMTHDPMVKSYSETILFGLTQTG
jgi:PIN domain nuclease of toxin-antitoxin system